MGKPDANAYEHRATFDAPPEAVIDAVVAVLEGMGASRIESSYRPPRVEARTRINWYHWRERIHVRLTKQGALVVSSRACGGAAFGNIKHKQNVDSILDGVAEVLASGPARKSTRARAQVGPAPTGPRPLLVADYLSRGGQIACGVVTVPTVVVWLVLVQKGIGFPAVMAKDMGGKLAFLALSVATVVFVGVPVGLLWDYVTKKGRFEPGPAEDEDEG